MTKQDFIKKWIGWVSYTNREKLTNEMEVDLELVSQALCIHDVVSDMEIETMAVRLYKGKDINEQRANLDKMLAFEKGAKWMLDKLLNNSR